jgi:hypothetical protein
MKVSKVKSFDNRKRKLTQIVFKPMVICTTKPTSYIKELEKLNRKFAGTQWDYKFKFEDFERVD